MGHRFWNGSGRERGATAFAASVVAAALVAASCGTDSADRGAPDADRSPQRSALAESPAAARAVALAGRFRRAAHASEPRLPPSDASTIETDGERLVPVLRSPGLVRVDYPASADAMIRIEDAASGVSIEVGTRAFERVAGEAARGYVVYPGAWHGADVIQRPRLDGTEDWIVLDGATPSVLEYDVALGPAVAGLRHVAGVVEIVDAGGAPRLRMNRAAIVDALGNRHEATASIEGCAYDADPSAPWGRAVTPPGTRRCTVRVEWDGSALAYPALLDPAWTATGNMTVGRYRAVGDLLGTGKVLVAGGRSTFDGVQSTAELYSEPTGTWAATGSMAKKRDFSSGTLLADGRFLIVGGDDSASAGSWYDAEIYSPSTGTWALQPAQTRNLRGQHRTVLLANGKALVSGGFGAETSAELFDPTSGTPWSNTGDLVGGRYAHVAARLPNGEVLAAGGYDGTTYLSTAERYSVTTGLWTSTGSMAVRRRHAAGVLLADGRYLVTGGVSTLSATSTAELYSYLAGTWAAAGSMSSARADHTVTRLWDDKILAAGDTVADVYDPTSNAWKGAGALVQPRGVHVAARVAAAKVVLAGSGTPSAESTAEIFQYLANGQACTGGGECSSFLCPAGDGKCCNTACGGVCQACATGTCATVTSADDPDTCTGTNTCDAVGACKKKTGQACAVASECASGFCKDGYCCGSACTAACQTCSATPGSCTTLTGADDVPECTGTNTCDAAGACKKKTGQSCGAPSECATGFCANGYCCSSACTGGCDVCNVTPGTCTTVAPGSPGASPSCSPYLCAGGAACPTTCASDANCQADHWCRTSDGTCQPDQAAGATCTAASQCTSGICTDGRCCTSACGTPCRTCAGATPGTCTPVTSADDVPECTGNDTCDGAAACKLKNGQVCTLASQCASGFCVDGRCCNAACSGGCDVCNANPGTCTIVAPGSAGANPPCSPYVCGGAAACPSGCTSDAGCGATFFCAADGTCQPRKSNGAACDLNAGADCKVSGCRACTSSNCVDGFCCNAPCGNPCDVCAASLGASANGTCTTAPVTYPGDPVCSPYACNGTANSCPASCTSDAQCASTHFCNPSNVCQLRKGSGAVCNDAAGADCLQSGCRVCQSGSCRDGYCCDAACAGACLTCSNSPGTCTQVTGGDDLDTCTGTSTCDAAGACKKKTGQLCAAGSECVTGNCADGFCCNTPCAGGCDVCNATPGTCTIVASGNPGASPSCAPQVCSGASPNCPGGCNSDADCAGTHYCSASGSCQPRKATGAACNSSAGADCLEGGCRTCQSTHCVDGVCCNAACSGGCDVCSAALGASANGTCSNAPAGYAGNPPCNQYVCSGSSAACPAVCTSDSGCAPNFYCDKNGQCQPRKAQGAVCSVAAGVDCLVSGCRVCSTSSCADGFCCDSACSGSCQTCAATPGSCTSVTNGPDPGTCSGASSCDAAGVCKLRNGGACAAGADCISGNCVDGLCCDAPCGGACQTCATVPGVCTSVGDGNPSPGGGCAPYLCGAGTACPSSCVGDFDCEAGFYCAAGGTCQPQKAQGLACAPAAGADCRQAGCRVCQTGFCSDGFCCESACGASCDVCSFALGAAADGACSTAPAGYSGSPTCSPFVCGGSTTACSTACGSDADCAATHYCAADATCKLRKNQGAVCSAAAGADCLFSGCRVCSTGFCVDGVCCDGGCSGPCDVCSRATGATTDGACAAAPAGSPGNPSCSPYVCTGTGAACGSTCATDAECSPAAWCDGGNGCRPDQALGAPCTAASQCTSGRCVDGVCCNAACDGLCQACTAAFKGFGSDGTCGNVSDGKDPRGDCTDGGAAACGHDGQCNGAGACRLYVQGVACGPTACTGNKVQGEICNGFGACVTDNAGTDCAPYVCTGTACANPCAADSDCVAGNFCDSGTCKARQANGYLCTSASQCASGNCVDGVCCDTTCTGLCQACSAAKKGSGQDGACGVIAASTDPDGECDDDGAASCARNGDCDGTGSCQRYAAGTVCGATSCSGTTFRGQVCNGLGSCVTDSVGTDCAPFACAGGACNTTCTGDGDCAAGAFCDTDGACKAGFGNGEPCTKSSGCASGFCVDSFCCNEPCTSQCAACDVAGSPGICAPVQGAPHGTRTPCVDAADECGGSCDGVNGASCKYPPAGKECGARTCEGGTAKSGACDGQAACAPGADRTCSPFGCGAMDCNTTCAVDSDCARGFTCTTATGECVPATGTCIDDVTLETAAGGRISCEPYACSGGSCRTTCSTSGDCASRFVCDATSEQCVASDAGKSGSGDEGGCGCRAGKPSARGLAWLLLAAAVALVRLRSRVRARP